MADQTHVQHLRGNTEGNDAFTGAAGELTVDTEVKTIRMHDGVKVGGYPLVSTVSNQAIDGEKMFLKSPTAPTVADASDTSTKIATTAFVQAAIAQGGGGGGGGGGGIKGMVVSFSGNFGGTENRNPIPLGSSTPDTSWVLCDGGSDGMGGTVPDLRGRMLIGVSSSYAKGSTGGSSSHSHSLSGSTSSASPSGMSVSGSVGSTTLTTDQIPAHRHDMKAATDAVAGTTKSRTAGWNSSEKIQVDRMNWAGGGGSHTHGLSGLSVSGGSHSHTNSGSAASTTAMPPYYALAYIIKVA